MSESTIELGGVGINLGANLDSELKKFGGEDVEPAPWASEFANYPPLFHVGTLEGIRYWAQIGNTTLKSHRALHPLGAFFGDPENTSGQTCREDILRGLNEYVFMSIGMLATGNPAGFAAIVLEPRTMDKGLVSLKELAAFDNILLSPAERFGEHDENEVKAVNQSAFEDYTRTIVAGKSFPEVFARYLSMYFESDREFLSTHDYIPGKKDIPPKGSLAYKEMMARRKLLLEFGQPSPLEVTEGYPYHGPQLKVANEVGRECIKGVLIYSRDAEDRGARLVAKTMERNDMPAFLLTSNDIVQQHSNVAENVFARGIQQFKDSAKLRAMFNLGFVAAVSKLDS